MLVCLFDRRPNLSCRKIQKLHLRLFVERCLQVCVSVYVSIPVENISPLQRRVSVCVFMQRRELFPHRAIVKNWNLSSNSSKKEKDSRHVCFFFGSYFVSNLFCLTYLLTLIWFCRFLHRPPHFPPTAYCPSRIHVFFKSHLRLAGMSYHSSVPCGAAPVILRGHVHLSKQWIKKHPEAGIRGLLRTVAERMKNNIYFGELGCNEEPFFKGQRSVMAATCH